MRCPPDTKPTWWAEKSNIDRQLEPTFPKVKRGQLEHVVDTLATNVGRTAGDDEWWVAVTLIEIRAARCPARITFLYFVVDVWL